MQIERYIPPHGHPLAAYIQSIWRVRTPKTYSVETILPKGNVDLLFNLGHQHRLKGGAMPRLELPKQDVTIAGLHTQYICSTPVAAVDLLGVSLRMETCAALLPVPPAELADHAVEGSLVLPGMDDLLDQVASTRDFARQTALLLRWLDTHLQVRPTTELLDVICRALQAAPHSETLDAVCTNYGISSRHLRRLFRQHVGVSPSQYLQLSRFAQALHLMSGSGTSLTAVAHSAGYFDQAHFCRDFRSIAGMTPGEYRKRGARAPGHLFD